MDCYIGIDLGTSSVRAMALGDRGNVLGVQGRSYPIHEPKPGFAEQSTVEWWNATVDCLRMLQQLDSLKGTTIRAVGLSGQMHGLVLLDGQGRALRDAIIWPDRRTASLCSEWSETIGTKTISSIAGLPVATGFMAPSLAWVKRNEPDTYAKAVHAILPKDYIRYRLTGEIGTDVTDASGSLLFDVVHRTWSADLLGLYQLDGHLLPPVLSTAEVAGTVTEDAAAATGLTRGTPVAAGGADIAMSAYAHGVDSPGRVVVSIATGGTVVAGIDRPVLDERIHTICSATPGQWILMGATLSAGLALSWFAENVAVPLGAKKETVLEKLLGDAQKVPPGSEGLLFAPYLCGERTPYMDPYAKGSFVGLSLRHTSSHMARAIMEGVAYSLCESLDIFDALNVPVSNVLCSGGGARSVLWRQILADVFNRPVGWEPGEEHSAIGAALVGATARGHTIAASVGYDRTTDVVSPDSKRAQLYQHQREIFRLVYPQLASVFHKLS